MAYYLHYIVNGSNPLGETLVAEIYKKDVVPTEVVSLRCKSIRHEYRDGNDDPFEVMVASVAEIVVRVGITVTQVDNETFMPDYYDQYKVIIKDDDQTCFVGFIDPTQSAYILKDKPYDVLIRCSDGLGLLAETPLQTVNDTEFDLHQAEIAYIAGALKKTGLDLPIRIYCDVFSDAMLDRYVDIENDMFQQIFLDARTFYKSPSEKDNCWDALRKMLTGFQVYQWYGRWVIRYTPQMQTTIGPTNYWTEYNYMGVVTGALQDVSNEIHIGKNKRIFPIDVTQQVLYSGALKSVRTFFNYDIVHNLLNNENNHAFGDFISALSGSGYSAWELVGWQQKENNPNAEATYGGTKNAYIRTETDAFGIEQERYFVVENDEGAAGDLNNFIRNVNNDFIVREGDKITISMSARTPSSGAPVATAYGQVVLFIGGDPAVGTNYWTLGSDSSASPGWINSPSRIFSNTILGSINWKESSSTESIIPATGRLYVKLGNVDTTAADIVWHYRYPTISYQAYLVGSNESVKGDQWTTTQTLNVKDKAEEETFVGDAPREILKGAFFIFDAVSYLLSSANWGMLDGDHTFQYKELINLGHYRMGYRRYRKISGIFKGIKMQSENEIATSVYYPLGFHKQFSFGADNAYPSYYILVPPLSIDYTTGRFTGTFYEVLRDADDFSQNGDTHVHNYNF